MKTYSTLRGFVAGEEPADIEPWFAYSASFRVFSESTLNLDEITETLGLQPTTLRRRGDRRGPQSPPSKHDAWHYQAPIAEELELGHHIDALWQALAPHVEFLKRLKTHAEVDVFLGYRSNIDHAGLMIPHRSLAMFVALEIDLGVSVIVTPD